MNLLLDTHALLWWLRGAPLRDEAHEAIADQTNLVAVSAASVWEASIKKALGKLRFKESLVEAVVAASFEPLAVSAAHAERAGALPPHHRDPFDRMLVAQAQVEGLTIVTRDTSFNAYDVSVLAC